MSDKSHPISNSSDETQPGPQIVTQRAAVPAEAKQAAHKPENVAERLVFTPPIDIYEDENGLVLYADLPGVTADSLELQVQNNKLTLFGRVAPLVDRDAVVLHREYEVGDFLRSFILSDDVDHERITANLTGGVLKVVLPRTRRSPARQIPVQTD